MESHKHRRETDPAIDKSNVIDFLNNFEIKHRAFISLILRPLFMLLMFLSVGYYTMWLSSTYVKQSQFGQYAEKQDIEDAKQDELAKTRFEVVQTKLDAIINQQTIYTEQLKSVNQLMINQQKDVDDLNERVTYLERNYKLYHSENKTP